MRRHTSDTGERVLNTDDPLSPGRGAESLKRITGARDVKDGGWKGSRGSRWKEKWKMGEERKREGRMEGEKEGRRERGSAEESSL